MSEDFHRHYTVVFHFCITGQPVAASADANGWAEPARQALLAAPKALQRYLAQRMLRDLDEISEGGSIDQGLGPFVLGEANASSVELLRQTGSTDPQVQALIEFLEDDEGDAFLEFEPVGDSFDIRITDVEVNELSEPTSAAASILAPAVALRQAPAQPPSPRKAARRAHKKGR
jgi:hypothetical protein